MSERGARCTYREVWVRCLQYVGDVERAVFGLTGGLHALSVHVTGRGHQHQVVGFLREDEACVPDLATRDQEVKLGTDCILGKVIDLSKYINIQTSEKYENNLLHQLGLEM